MSLVQNINVPPEDQELWAKSCVIRTGNFGVRVDKKEMIGRRRDFTSLIARGNYQSLASLWDSLTTLQKEAWDDAGYWAGMSGWDLFAQDTLYRINNNLIGIAIPDLYHQYFVGEIKINSPADSIWIKQNYNDLPDTPIDFAFNVLSDLVSTGAGSYAKFIVTIETGFWNDDTDSPEVLVYEYDLTLATVWEYISDSYVDGFYGYGKVTYEIKVYKMTGLLFIDGIELDYNDENHAYDFQCNLLPYNWTPVSVPENAFFDSVYCPDAYN